MQDSEINVPALNARNSLQDAYGQVEFIILLISPQIKLEDSQQKAYANKSLHDTVHHLLLDGQTKEAEKLRVEFKIPERRLVCDCSYALFHCY